MTFKENWEKTNQNFQIEKSKILEMLSLALPDQKISSYKIISGGCANLNIKLNCADNSPPLILRIYLRDKDAAYREQKLAMLIKENIPIPEIYSVDDFEDYRFAITEYKHGFTLRDLLLSNKIENIHDIMMDVGILLSKIHLYRFAQSGFFDNNLIISHPITQEWLVSFAKKCLDHPTTTNQISKETLNKIHSYFEKYHFLFPDSISNNLVHADFDPANILVEQKQNGWKISAILDWEFAFSGSTLCDMANMLRYAHHMPPAYEKGFISGLQNCGFQLPENWRISIFLLNLLSLLDCLVNCPPDKRPKQCADICSLIAFIVHSLETSHINHREH